MRSLFSTLGSTVITILSVLIIGVWLFQAFCNWQESGKKEVEEQKATQADQAVLDNEFNRKLYNFKAANESKAAFDAKEAGDAAAAEIHRRRAYAANEKYKECGGQ